MPIWMPVDDQPNEFELEIGERKELLAYVGPSLHGWVVRSCSAPAYYKLIPVDKASLPWRRQVNDWVEQGQSAWPPGLVRIAAAEEIVQMGDAQYFCFRYALAEGARSLVDLLREADAPGRLRSVVRVLRALPAWWTHVSAPLVPMAADVVFTADESPCLLALPFVRLPDVETVFAEPVRAMALSPELLGVRSAAVQWTPQAWQNVDRYAIGSVLMESFFAVWPPAGPELLLRQVATGTVWNTARRASRLPFWLQRVQAAQQAIALAVRMVSPDPAIRGQMDLSNLAERLEHCCDRMKPQEAVLEVRNFGQPADALRLAQEILLTEESYELLLLAGETALHAARPLEAVDFFERAIARAPQRPEAYARQLSLIARSFEHAPLENIHQQQSVAALQLDALAWRDFQALPPDSQEEQEVAMAKYLVWHSSLPGRQGELDRAATFIHQRLYDKQNVFAWWKLALNLAYLKVLVMQTAWLRRQAACAATRQVAQERMAGCYQQLRIVREAYLWLTDQGLFDPAEAHEFGEELNDLEVSCHALQQEMTPP